MKTTKKRSKPITFVLYFLLLFLCGSFYYQLSLVDLDDVVLLQSLGGSSSSSSGSSRRRTTTTTTEEETEATGGVSSIGAGGTSSMATINEGANIAATVVGAAPDAAGTGTASDSNDNNQDNSSSRSGSEDNHHRVAGLSCNKYGGPYNDDAVQEMVYWKDVPTDSTYIPPLKANEEHEGEYYLTFENDEGGFNNIRMAAENAVVMALVTGRTLVIPPQQDMYLLMDKGTNSNNNNNTKKKNHHKFSMTDFFHFNSVAREYPNFNVITFQQFLEQTAMKGKLLSVKDNTTPVFPPNNVTDWTGLIGPNWDSTKQGNGKLLWNWMRNDAAYDIAWNSDECVAAFPSRRLDRYSIHKLQLALNEEFYRNGRRWSQRIESFNGNPTPVNDTVINRLSEMLADRHALCIYNETLQHTKVIHLKGEESTGHRLLVHFYAFQFFQDWHTDLWVKRFVRDHLRYVDEIQCAAARVVKAVRQIAKQRSSGSGDNDNNNSDGSFDTFHIRRGDFEYKEMHMSAVDIYYNNTKHIIKDGRTVFVATDEKRMEYFEPLRKHYYMLFLKDFTREIGDELNVNYYGMVDQLVASKGDVFFGAYFSTFTGYINRLRGYHSQMSEADGYEQGIINSYYYTPSSMKGKRRIMRSYHSLRPGFWSQEFPVGWRMIDEKYDNTIIDSAETTTAAVASSRR